MRKHDNTQHYPQDQVGPFVIGLKKLFYDRFLFCMRDFRKYTGYEKVYPNWGA